MIFEQLNIVAKDLCEIALNDPSHKHFMPVLKNCVRELRDLNMLVLPSFKTIEKEVSDNLTVALPDDCMLALKVGVCSNGEIIEIFTSEDVCVPSETACTCNSTNTTSSETASEDFYSGPHRCSFCTFYYNDNRGGTQFHEAYWVRPGMGSMGSFILDETNNSIALGSRSNLEVGDKLLITYKSDSTNNNETASLVPQVAWKVLVYKTREMFGEQTVGKLNLNRKLYESEYNRIKKFYRRTSKQAWENMILGTKHSDPRR